MSLTVSTPVKILGLIMVLAGVGFVASLSMMGKSSSTSTIPPAGQRHGSAARPRVTTPAKTTPATTAKPAKHAPKHATAPTQTKIPVKRQVVSKPKPAVKPVQRGNLVYNTLPKALQWELSQHKVVVVSIYNPNSDVDAISVAEAHAGATDANAGFLLVNVLDNKLAGILTALLPGGGLLPDPGVLVYRAPGDVAIRLDGFHDRDAVAQAAVNAGEGDTDPSQALNVSAAPTGVTAATTGAATSLPPLGSTAPAQP